ncbi:MAG: hypothetical protein ACRDWA_07370 [Acidimicrobiia bacterium]
MTVRQLRLPMVLVLGSVAAVLIAAALPSSILPGDAEPYRLRMAELFSGKIPYVEFDFEHLPGAIVPMAAAWLLGGSSSLQSYVLALAAVSTICLLATGAVLRRLESTLGAGLAWRWALAVLPLLPFLLFRNDSWPVLLTVIAFALGVRRSKADSLVAALGALSKFWPATWSFIDWWRGRRLRAMLIAALGMAMLGLLRTEAVTRIQRPVGIHSETLGGSLLAVVRGLQGRPLGLHQTSALYIEAAPWVTVANAFPGLVIAALVLTGLRRPFSWLDAWTSFGLLVGAVVLASPLFSTQYLAWLAPFLAARATWLRAAFVINAASLGIILAFDVALRGEMWWFGGVVGRNLALLALLVCMALRERRSGSPFRVARTNPIHIRQ